MIEFIFIQGASREPADQEVHDGFQFFPSITANGFLLLPTSAHPSHAQTRAHTRVPGTRLQLRVLAVQWGSSRVLGRHTEPIDLA